MLQEPTLNTASLYVWGDMVSSKRQEQPLAIAVGTQRPVCGQKQEHVLLVQATANSASCFHTSASISYSHRKWLMGTQADAAIPANNEEFHPREAEKDTRCLQCSLYQSARCFASLKSSNRLLQGDGTLEDHDSPEKALKWTNFSFELWDFSPTEGVSEDMRVDFYFQNVAFVYF